MSCLFFVLLHRMEKRKSAECCNVLQQAAAMHVARAHPGGNSRHAAAWQSVAERPRGQLGIGYHAAGRKSWT